jgi:hypothetical protein
VISESDQHKTKNPRDKAIKLLIILQYICILKEISSTWHDTHAGYEVNTRIDGFDAAGFADQFPSKAKQVTMYQWILLIFLVESPCSNVSAT